MNESRQAFSVVCMLLYMMILIARGELRRGCEARDMGRDWH